MKIFGGVVIAFTSILAVSSAWNDVLIVDEVPHIGAGYSYVVKQDYRLNPEHPPLAKDLAGIPLSFLHLNQDAFYSKPWVQDVNGQWEFGRQLMFNSGNNADLIKHVAKLPMLLFFILSAILIYRWAWRLYGETGALVALILFSFSPTVLAHSRFVTTDVPALFGVLYATYFFIRYLRRPTGKNMFIAEAVFGVALLTKFSTFLLVPYLGLLAVVWGWLHGAKLKDRIRLAIGTGLNAVTVFIIGFVVVVWPVYYLNTYNYPADRQHRDTVQLLSTYGNRKYANAVVWMSDKPVLRAAGHYGLGLLMVTQRAIGGNTTYFLGEVSRFGWRYYFPVVYFLKEPLAWWALVIIAILAIIWQSKGARFKLMNIGKWLHDHFEEFAMLLWLAVYWGASIKSTLNIGVRHLLPTYPFAILLVSGQAAWLAGHIKKEQIKKMLNISVVIAGLLGLYVFDSVRIWPFYLTYFNQVAGGPSGGHRFVVDSNLDWGQDLKRLADWVYKNNLPKIELDYFGWVDQAYYLKDRFIWLNSTRYKDAQDFVTNNRSDGWIAVSATFFEGSAGLKESPKPINYNWLKAYQPVTVIGNSIFVWHITK